MNDFEYPSQRTEREEYRSRFKFTDEDAPQRKSRTKPAPKTKTDYLIRLIFLQSVLCVIVVAGVFLVSKVSPAAYEKMREDYRYIMQKDMSAGEMFEQLKDTADFVFKPSEFAEPAMSGKIATETSAEKITVDSFEVTSDETGETVAVGEMIQNGTGGEDMESREAVKGTSFAPYYVSVEPVIPVKGARITSRFGYRTNPVSGNYGFHTGIDLAAAEGTAVSAAFYGRIAQTGESDVWGKYVLMEHSDGFATYYCHLSEIFVEEDAIIRQGETVGLVGSTGWSTGPHLHFEVRINGVRVDPERLLYPENTDEG
ncbi:MAG: M23 family metallopeptidase [Clostridia bacterium]|nr:M23 family metallopeptidase [Clostridia bacterium]